MPATEQTARDQKLLHVIFAVTGVVMLLATIWMFAADHAREWKPIQRSANRVETKTTEWREMQFETNAAIAEHKELLQQLTEANRQAIPADLLADFKAEIADGPAGSQSTTALDNAAEKLAKVAGQEAAEAHRAAVIAEMNGLIKQARFLEDTLLGKRKFKSADRDAAVAALGLLVRDGKTAEQPPQQEIVDQLKADLDDLTRRYQAAGDHRKELLKIVKQITFDEDEAADALDKNQAQLRTMQSANADRRSTYFSWYGYVPVPGKKWLELPILDAFNSPRKIDNLWSEGLVIDYNFSKVRRFDRCTTCHQLIQKTLPGSATMAAYPQQRLIHLVISPPAAGELVDPATQPVAADASGDAAPNAAEPVAGGSAPLSLHERLESIYGMRVAPAGLLERADVTVQFVHPGSPAARAEALIAEERHQAASGLEIREALMQPGSGRFHHAIEGPGLRVGDVLVEINDDGNRIYSADRTEQRLLGAAESGEPLVVTVRRGMPSPYASHPRLDLFVGSLSPHKMSEFACTICHEGQGSATAFKWASHSPDSVSQRKEWRREYGWFDNHHWIYPMYSQRFAESACLKCHHEVTELGSSERFPEAPAPKVTRGHQLVRKYGCFGCHEINGYDGPEQIGPDMRLEPNVFAAALQLRTDPGYATLTAEQAGWADELVQHPDRDGVRRRLYEVLVADQESDGPQLSADTHAHLTPLFKDSERPGQLRKAGPSLRYIGNKVDLAFLSDWIRKPKNFRPTTRMPQFFGQVKHLAGSNGVHVAKQFETVEIMGLAAFLLAKTQQFDYLEPPADTAAPSVERGKVLFEERGCLACHEHRDFPETAAYRGSGEVLQGPDLSGVGDKLSGAKGRSWLYSWIKEPTRYHARTVMPDLGLDPLVDADGNKTDPANDIVEYLLAASRVGWSPSDATQTQLSQIDVDDLDRLTLEHLKDVFSEATAEDYAKTGIPAEYRDELKGAEVELLASADPAYIDRELTAEQKLIYIGGKTVAKYGCYGCHDIAGYEDAKPIGTGLADWGRKDPSKLAFEHIGNYLHGDHGSHSGDAHQDDDHAVADDADHDNAAHDDAEHDDAADPFFLDQIAGHHRTGFIYQKLREPRSYDYHKTDNKRFNEWLRMPQFPFDAEDREDVITFVLGLVADPPAEKYVYQPDGRQRAIIEGKQVLDKFNCAGCHLLKPQQWAINYPPEFFGEQASLKVYPFLETHFSAAELAASELTEASGLREATIQGLPSLDDSGLPLVYDEEGDPLEDEDDYDPTRMEYPFDLWKATALDGAAYEVGVAPLNLPTKRITDKRESEGGFLAKYLVPRVVAREKQVNPNAKGTEAWGWVPPPLVGEGQKVQTDWLHDFLLNPYPIRPAVVLRMPRFNMTPLEAARIVNYFAAIDDAEYPYEFSDRRQIAHLEDAEAAYREQVGAGSGSSTESRRFTDAMSIVVDGNYCVKCHLVGDFDPPGLPIAKAPDLARVYERLRPDYVRDWIANPKSILPYTSMPINVPYDPDLPNLGGVKQDLYHGTSLDQIDGLVDLLMNFDEYSRQRSLVAPLVKELAPTGADSQPSAGE